MIRTLLLFLAAITTAGAGMPEPKIIYYDPEVYSAWPAIARAANGDILLAFATTEEHMSPNGSISLMRSTDNGQTWSGPEVVVDTLVDEREGGLTVAPNGDILLHIWATHWVPRYYDGLTDEHYPRAWIDAWIEQINTPEYLAAEKEGGAWVYRSRDHGHTWEKQGPGPDSLHGGITLQDGSLFTVSFRTGGGALTLHRAPGPDGPWEHIHTVPSPREPNFRISEPHSAQMPDGRIVVVTRSTPRIYDGKRRDLFLWEIFSDDNGKTWSEPFPTPMLGYPPHLLVLKDGRLLCAYGRRAGPYGIRAMISEDGISWNHASEIILNNDAPNEDLGYPVSVEIAPGRILTAFYQKPAWNPDDKLDHKTAIFTIEWDVPAPEHPIPSS